MMFLSDFADQAVILPVSGVVLLALVVIGWWRGAAAWLAAVGLTLFTILLLKAGLMMMTDQFGSQYQISPSGHVAACAVVYGGLAMLLLRDVLPRLLLGVLLAGLVAGMGVIRVDLGYHTVGEAVIGAMIGAVGLVVLAQLTGPRPRVAILPLTLSSGITALMVHGLHLGAEQAIRTASTGW